MKPPFSYIAIPCIDFERAFTFYHFITGGRLVKNPDVPFPMAYFTGQDNTATGHLFQLDGFVPSAQGSIVYLKLADDLNDTLEKIAAGGGKVIVPKTFAPGKGHWSLFLDTEGNKLGLHSEK